MRRGALVFIHNRPMPGSEANAVAVSSMCSAFAGLGLDTRLVSYPGEGGDIIARYGLPHPFRFLPARDRGGPLRYPSLIWRGVVGAPAGALIYTRVPQVAAYAALAGRRVALEMHTPISAVRRGARLARLLDRLSARLAVVVGVNAALTERLQAELPQFGGPWITAPSGAWDLSPPAGAAPPDHDVGYLGSARPGKGVEMVLALAARRPGLRFLVAGTLGEALASRAASLANVTLTGDVAPAQAAATLARFRIALAPYGRQVIGAGDSGIDLAPWMSPLKLVEAFSAGKAVLASRLEAVEALAVDGVNALLRPPDDVEAWLAALDALNGDPARLAALSSAGRRSFEEGLAWPVRAARIAGAAGLLQTREPVQG